MKNKKTLWWIIGAILLAGAGVGAYFMLRRKPDEPAAPPPPPPIETRTFSQNADDALNVDAYFGNNTTTPPPASAASIPATPKAKISIYDPTAVANIARVSQEIEKNPTLNGRARTMNAIGGRLFDGISVAAQEVIKRSFVNIMDGKFDPSSTLAYPIEGKYINPEMRAEVAKIVTQFPGGIVLNPKASKIGASNLNNTFGYMPSIQYNIVTGTRVPLSLTNTSPSTPDGIKPEEMAYHLAANELISPSAIGYNTSKFAKNWLSEIDRFDAAIREMAIKKLESEGWIFEERQPA
jgi:hypothetical protein